MHMFSNQNGHGRSPVPGPSANIWTPFPRKYPVAVDYNGEDLVSGLPGLQQVGIM